MIVPAVAVHQLVGLKKMEKGARDAFRWLGRGNRWLMAWKEGEAVKVEGMDYHWQRERKVWDRLQLLECLLLLGVTLLTGDPDLLPGGEDGVAWLPDLVVEVVEGFVPRFLGLEEKEPAQPAATQYQVGHSVCHHHDLADHHVAGLPCDQSPE